MEEPDRAAEAMKEDSIPVQIINQLGYGDFKNIVLTDAEINNILRTLNAKSMENANCTKQQQHTTSSSMVTFVSGHGNDLDVATRHTIVDAVLTLEFSFPELDYDKGPDGSYKKFASGKQAGQKKIKKTSYFDILVPDVFKTEAAFRKAFEKYIEKSVNLQIAMGEPGPSAPMSMAEKSDWTTLFSACKPDVCLQHFSSSEIDIYIVENAYNLLNNSALKTPTDCDLIEFNRVIRHILRANFINTWDEELKNVKDLDELWCKHYLKLLIDTKKTPDKPKVWVLKRISKSSFDRYYQLKPNEGEDPAYRVHEGLHIFDFRQANGAEVVDNSGQTVVQFNTWKEALKRVSPDPTDENEMLDTNNLKNPEFRAKFFEHIKTKFPIMSVAAKPVPTTLPEKNKAIRRAIAGILYSIEKEELYLSEICLLGFLLDIKMLTVYDPACRPVTHTIIDAEGNEMLSTTRSGLVRSVDNVYNILDPFLTQSSQP